MNVKVVQATRSTDNEPGHGRVRYLWNRSSGRDDESSFLNLNAHAAMPNSDPRNNPDVSVQAGFHVPITVGVAIGPNFSYTPSDRSASLKPDIALGSLGDFGASISFSGDSRYSGPASVGVGIGKYLGVQVTPSNVTAWQEKSWYDATRYINGVSVGIGAGFSTPVNASVDPTYQSPAKR